jgi:ribosomal subunit interface protein
MDVLVQGRNFNVTDRTREYISRKTQRLERHLPAVDQMRVDISEEGTRSQEHRIVVKVTLKAQGGAVTFSGEERAPNVFAAIDVLMDNLDRRLKRHKGKTYRSEQAKKGKVVSQRHLQAEEMAEEVESA